MKIRLAVATLLLTASSLSAQIPAPSKFNSPQQWKDLAHDVYKQLIELNTNQDHGTTEAAKAMAARLIAGGFSASDIQILGDNPAKQNLVARFHGRNTALKPLLLMAHLDVVEAKKEDWSFDPFVFREIDGWYYGRGTTDDKPMAAIFVTNLIRMKQQHIVPARDIVLALTADEETGDDNGVEYLLAKHRELVDAAYGINEGGQAAWVNGVRRFNGVQAAEKVFLSFYAEATNPGGHSSRPRKDNAIYHVAGGLTRLANFDFPVELSDITRTYFERMSKVESGQLAQDMAGVVAGDSGAIARLSENSFYNAQMRTTCVATMMQAGHAENALPQMARATINCRILPGRNPDDVERTLNRVLADSQIKLTRIKPPKPSDPSPLTKEMLGAIERVTNEMWPGVPVVPMMSTGASDGLYFRNAGIPIYGVDGLFEDLNDSRAHGKDERLAVQSFYEGQEFLWRLVMALTA